MSAEVAEPGGHSFPHVRTGTNNDGTVGLATCGDWLSGSDWFNGTYGTNDFPVASSVWSARAVSQCPSPMRLYCFEQ